MTDYGHFTATDEDDSFEGEFDQYENPVIVVVEGPNRETRCAIKMKVGWGHELDAGGHVFGGVVEDSGLGDTDDLDTVRRNDHVVVTTDGFDRATRARNPMTREGEPTALGRNARVMTERRWAEVVTARREAEHEAKLDRQRERAMDRNGHFPH